MGNRICFECDREPPEDSPFAAATACCPYCGGPLETLDDTPSADKSLSSTALAPVIQLQDYRRLHSPR